MALVKMKLDATDKAAETRKSAVSRAKAKQKPAESMEDAWQRVLATKLSDADRAKLLRVKAALEAGTIGRHADKLAKRFSKAEAQALYRDLVEVERESTLKQMVANTPGNYVMVRDYAELDEMIATLAKEPIIAVDTETTGVDVYSDVIVGMSFTAPTANLHYYVPTDHVEKTAIDTAGALTKLAPILADESIGKVLHNAKYDIHMFRRHGVDMRGLAWDTQEAMQLLNENEPSMALKNLATKYLNEPSDTFSELFGKDAKFAEVPLDVAMVYAAKDTHITWKLYEFQRKHFAKMPSIERYLREVEVPLIYAIVDMERNGFVIDLEFAKTYGDEMKQRLDALEAELVEELNGINLNSPAQLKPALESLVGRKLESTDAKKVLKPLAKDYPTIAKLLEYKGDMKLYSTYISRLPELIHPKTDRLHAQFRQNGTVTGRFSSGGGSFNTQNQPKSARKLFVAPKGHVIMGGDWSQQEVRALAYFTQEPTLLEAYATGRDIYASMASEVYNKPYEECGDGTFERKAMKVGVLSCMYGTGPATLAQQLGITRPEADAFIEDFFKRLPMVQAWIDGNKRYAARHGFVWMDGEQRKRRLPDAKKRVRGYDRDKSRAERQATNAIIQGSSAIQTKVTLIALHDLCKRKGWQLWATVHDEVLLVVPEDITDAEVSEFERVMLESYPFGEVANKTDIELGRCWGEMKSRKEWFA